MLISENYRTLNQKLHETNPAYGTSSKRWIELIKTICKDAGTKLILDYGCGKGLLKQGLGKEYQVTEYDPAIPGKQDLPAPSPVVVCTDVLEHIEPECLESVLDDLQRLTQKKAFLTIATRPAVKFLEDGRNAHLIQEPWSWWKPKIESRFLITGSLHDPGELVLIVRPKENV